MNLLDKIGNKSQLIVVALVVFSVFVGLGCISAADFDALDYSQLSLGGLNHHVTQDNNFIMLEKYTDAYNRLVGIVNDNTFIMSERYNASTGYHWKISPKTHGVTLMNEQYEIDHPEMVGSPGTVYFKFLVQNNDDYYVQLDLVSPTGKIVDSVNSTMLN